MSTSKNIAKHLREVHFGRNWTASSLKEQLDGVTWQEATKQVHDFNTIAVLLFHVNYYVDAATNVFEGKPLNSKDELSFNHPPINSEKDWQSMISNVLDNAEKFAQLIEVLPDEKLWEPFTDEKYGIYYRNLSGIIEHTHYHLGQIALIKKLVRLK